MKEGERDKGESEKGNETPHSQISLMFFLLFSTITSNVPGVVILGTLLDFEGGTVVVLMDADTVFGFAILGCTAVKDYY